MSFASAENPHFQALLAQLRPGYRGPTRRCVAGPLLNSVYNDKLAKVKLQIAGMMGTLMVDGWSSPCGDPVIAISVSVGGRSFLLGDEDTVGCAHTAEYLLGLVRVYL